MLKNEDSLKIILFRCNKNYIFKISYDFGGKDEKV